MEQKNKKGKKENSKGFYIAVCCCVAALGITGYISNQSKIKHSETMSLTEPTNTATAPTPKPTEKAVETPVPTNSPTKLPLPEAPVSTPIPTDLPEQKNITVIETSAYTDPDDFDIVEVGEPQEFYADNITTSVTVNSDPNFIMPVKGDITSEFSGETLVFNTALGDWRSHNGIDILAQTDTEVLAAADGIIKDIYSDYLGNVVVITHANGYETLYGCLKDTGHLTIGADILQGDVISTVSEIPQGENEKNPHLHFELVKSGSHINPADVIE